ncbi:uncharacterized protein [Diadema setosum]|uniref:uncharacterized protein n=1 Tax=Diadema setosum TaxID=31175 RepID=UPI003B3A00FE
MDDSDLAESDFGDYSEDISDTSEEDDGDDCEIAGYTWGEKPYMFEPLAEEPGPEVDKAAGENPESAEDGVDSGARLGNNDWCLCSGGCTPMPTVEESKCCKELQQIVTRMDEYPEELGCITAHPGFQTVCLNQWVLETAYNQYIQQYGEEILQDASENEKSRHMAYRQLAWWCWEYLGRQVRVPLPSCAVNLIRNTFQ